MEDISEKVILILSYFALFWIWVFSPKGKIQICKDPKDNKWKKIHKMLYPHIEFFTGLLDSSNKIIVWNAMEVIVNLSSVILSRVNEVF